MRRAMLARTLAGSTLVAGLGVCLFAGTLDAATTKRTRSRTTAAAPSKPDSNQVLVRIGKGGITRADVQRRIESLPEQFRANYTTPEGRQQLLERMVEERVWLSLATQNGVAERPDVKVQLDQQRRDLLVRTYLNEVMSTNAAPSDSEAQAYYDAHLDEYRTPGTVTLRHIQTKTEADAKKALQWAKGKQKWDDLVKRLSTDTLTRASGGSLGTVTKDGVFASIGSQPALAQAAFGLEEGQIGGPYKSDRGWHVIKVENKKEDGVRPLDQVRSMILRQLNSQRSQEFYKSKLEEARRTLGVRPDSAAIKGYVSQKKSARDLFNEAQTLTDANARVEAYRSLLAQYPDSDVSPQAQFMIGFIYSEEQKNYEEAEKAFRALLERYPNAELAPSAQWMLEHMREENAPPFIELDADSNQAPAGSKPPAGKNRKLKPWSPPSHADSSSAAQGKP